MRPTGAANRNVKTSICIGAHHAQIPRSRLLFSSYIRALNDFVPEFVLIVEDCSSLLKDSAEVNICQLYAQVLPLEAKICSS